MLCTLLRLNRQATFCAGSPFYTIAGIHALANLKRCRDQKVAHTSSLWHVIVRAELASLQPVHPYPWDECVSYMAMQLSYYSAARVCSNSLFSLCIPRKILCACLLNGVSRGQPMASTKALKGCRSTQITKHLRQLCF